MTGLDSFSRFAYLLNSPAQMPSGDGPMHERAVVTLHDGRQFTIDCGSDADIGLVQEFIDTWQSGASGGVAFTGYDSGGNPVKVPVEYRDVRCVDIVGADG